MSKYGFNENEVRKTITTQIDKDGFHKQTVTYGKDSGGSGEWTTANVTFINTGDENHVPYYVNISNIHENTFNICEHLEVHDSSPLVATIPLFNGEARIDYSAFESFNSNDTPIVEGDVEFVNDDNGLYFRVFGDCSIELLGFNDK